MDCLGQVHVVDDLLPVLSTCVGPDWPGQALFGLICLLVILAVSGVLAALIVRS